MNSSTVNYYFVIFCVFLISGKEVSSHKCLWDYLISRFYLPQPMTTELMLVPLDSTDPVCENEQWKAVPAGYNGNSRKEKKKIKVSSVKSESKNKILQQDDNTVQAEGKRNTAVDPEENKSTFGLNLENLITIETLVQIFAITFALVISWLLIIYEYLLTQKILGETEDIQPITSDDSEKLPPEPEEKIPLNFSNDELSWVISSTMVYAHIQNLVKDCKESTSEENLEKYLNEELLQLISDHIAEDGFMRTNFQDLLTAESLLRLGKFHYQKNRNYGNSEHTSSL